MCACPRQQIVVAVTGIVCMQNNTVYPHQHNLTMTLHMLVEGAARSQINRWYNSNSIIGNASSAVYKQVVFSTAWQDTCKALVTNKRDYKEHMTCPLHNLDSN